MTISVTETQTITLTQTDFYQMLQNYLNLNDIEGNVANATSVTIAQNGIVSANPTDVVMTIVLPVNNV